ncbi:class I SAM-dependent methyltransferase [Nanoarchaeota archaeon]
MEKKYEAEYSELERENWWFIGRRGLISAITNKILKEGDKVLDIGCSTGINARAYSKGKKLNIYGLDSSKTLLTNPDVFKGMKIICGNAEKLPFKDKYFDNVVCFDLLEHLNKDNQCVKESYRVLKTGGKFIIFVPAFQFLWNDHDVVNEHKRRYSKKSLKKLLANKGFKIRRMYYWNSFLFLPILIFKIFRRTKNPGEARSDHSVFKMPKIFNLALLTVLKIENFLINLGISLPFGISLIAIAEKE